MARIARLPGARAAGVALLAVAVALGCGSDEPVSSEHVRPMGAARSTEPSKTPGDAGGPGEAADAGISQDAGRGRENQPPQLQRVSIEPGPPLIAGREIRVVADAIDPEGAAIEYRYRWWLNDAEIEHSADRYDTTDLKRGDALRVSVVASDGWNESAPIESPVMVVANAAPRILSQPGEAEPDGSFRYAVEAEDTDGSSELSYRLEKGPKGMDISAATGVSPTRRRPPRRSAPRRPFRPPLGKRTTRSSQQLYRWLRLSPPKPHPVRGRVHRLVDQEKGA